MIQELSTTICDIFSLLSLIRLSTFDLFYEQNVSRFYSDVTRTLSRQSKQTMKWFFLETIETAIFKTT